MVSSYYLQRIPVNAKGCSHFALDRIRKLLLLWLVLISVYSVGFGQLISGTVYNKSTAEVIPLASVYFNGTALGTTTNQQGYFELLLLQEISNPLIVSAVGFYSVTLNNFQSGEQLSVRLEPKTYELLEVEVSGDESRNIRKEYFPTFRKEFLGKKINPKRCRILNESDILLHYDRNEKCLKAFANGPIQIQNDELGYKISYFLDRFEFNTAKHSLVFTGNYIFTPLNAKDGKQQKEFEKEEGRHTWDPECISSVRSGRVLLRIRVFGSQIQPGLFCRLPEWSKSTAHQMVLLFRNFL